MELRDQVRLVMRVAVYVYVYIAIALKTALLALGGYYWVVMVVLFERRHAQS